MVFGRLGVEGLIYPFRFRSYQVEAIREIVGAVRSGFRVVVLEVGMNRNNVVSRRSIEERKISK